MTEKMDMKRLFASVLAFASASAAVAAVDMAETARTIATIETTFSGTAQVACNDPGGWTFKVAAEVDDGRDVVKVSISAPDARRPPKFGVLFRVGGAGIQNVWTSNAETDGYHLWPQLWWCGQSRYISELACDTPIAVGFNSSEKAPAALACSEAFNHLEFGLYADDRTCEIVGRCEFFRHPSPPLTSYTVKVMFDRRNRGFADTVRGCTEWVMKENGFRPAYVPESAYDPLYSTWYAYLQDVEAKELEREAAVAASMGLKTMILDDGWQKAESRTFYSATGDWKPSRERFPDMKAHVAAVRAAGLKYMLWLGVPMMGDEAEAFPRFRDKLLDYNENGSGVGHLDPRFPEVREYLITTYERVVRDWGFDGVKLDFIDSFKQPENDPALKDMAGRDFLSVPAAVDRLMKDVLARLRKINPEVLVEFRQHYIGPAILQYGNMIRVLDCPADPTANRRRMCDLRLTSGNAAVHSDMLVWSGDETAEGAALPILNVLYSTIQYSMILAKMKPAHADVVRHWLRFSQSHRGALLKGTFTPHHPENGYTWIEGEDEREKVVTTYSNDNFLPVESGKKTVYV
ncbi:MAG: alpha-galactosidase, partial [Kiritimatiellae bacterium]|nr:alpha-galactosidase [Kiritimatiellia bacterium]